MLTLEFIAQFANVSIVKVGKEGSLILKDGERTNVGVIEAKVIDTTGAGDYYASGFLYGYLSGFGLNKAGQIGSLLAGKVIEEMGAQINDATWDFILKEVERIKMS